MKVHFCSDIHVEFGRLAKPFPQGEILILAGDITLARCLPSRANDAQSRGVRKATEALMKEVASKFERVFWLTGNHEPYNFNISRTPGVIREFLAKYPKIKLLDDDVVHLSDDVILVGGSLWTDMNKGEDCWFIGRGMNDFRCIRMDDPRPPPVTYEGERSFRPEDAMVMFEKTKALIAATAEANPDKTIIVATHHAPSIKGLNPEHSGGAEFGSINHGYYTDLEEFIAAHANIRHWIFGHTHVQKEFKIAQCMCHSNARGYVGHERTAETFDPERHFEVKPMRKRKVA